MAKMTRDEFWKIMAGNPIPMPAQGQIAQRLMFADECEIFLETLRKLKGDNFDEWLLTTFAPQPTLGAWLAWLLDEVR